MVAGTVQMDCQVCDTEFLDTRCSPKIVCGLSFCYAAFERGRGAELLLLPQMGVNFRLAGGLVEPRVHRAAEW